MRRKATHQTPLWIRVLVNMVDLGNGSFTENILASIAVLVLAMVAVSVLLLISHIMHP